MPTPEATKPDAPFHRPGWQIEPHLFCPRCRHPLLRWGDYRDTPEWIQVVWDPDRAWFPMPWQGLVLMVLIVGFIPATWFLFTGRPGLVVIEALGFVWAAVSARLEWRWRLRRRAELDAELCPHDWVCARCLHAQPGEAVPTS